MKTTPEIKQAAGSRRSPATCSRFFISQPGDLIPPHHSQKWQEWEVGDRRGQDRICGTSCKRKAELIRDALEAFHAKDEVIRVSRVCRLLKLENDIYRNAIEQAIVELCPRARPSQARRILRIGLGQDPEQIYNAEPDSSGNSHAHHVRKTNCKHNERHTNT